MRDYGRYVDEALRLVARPVRELVLEASGSPPPNLNLKDPYYLFKWALSNWEEKFAPALAKKHGLDEPTLRRVRTLLFTLKDARNAWAHHDPWRDREEWARQVLLSAAQLMGLLNRKEEAGTLLELEKRVLARFSSPPPVEGEAGLAEKPSPAQALEVFRKALEARLGYPGDGQGFPSWPVTPGIRQPSWVLSILDWLYRSLREGGIISLLQKAEPDEEEAHVVASELVERMVDYQPLEGLIWSHALMWMFWRLEYLYEILDEEELTESWTKQVDLFAAHLGTSLAEAELAMTLYVIPFADKKKILYGFLEEDQKAQDLLSRRWDLIEAFRQKHPDLKPEEAVKALREDPAFVEIEEELEKRRERYRKKLRRKYLARIQELLNSRPEKIPEILGMKEEMESSLYLRLFWWFWKLEKEP